MGSEMCIRDRSTALSTISYIRWFSPFRDTLPIYMPGRFLTASSPSNTEILPASYVILFAIFSFLSPPEPARHTLRISGKISSRLICELIFCYPTAIITINPAEMQEKKHYSFDKPHLPNYHDLFLRFFYTRIWNIAFCPSYLLLIRFFYKPSNISPSVIVICGNPLKLITVSAL